MHWDPDLLGDGFTATTVDLGADPDGETPVVATVIRHRPDPTPPTGQAPRAAVLYVHGFTDYFFQAPLAEAFAATGFDFFALDLRKCGRSRRDGQTPHHITDLATYDADLNAALDIVEAETGGAPVVVAAHSTGGLITPLWLDRLRRTDPVRHARVAGLALNSPWFDLQGAPALRSYGTLLVHAVAAVAPTREIPQRLPGGYGESLHVSAHGEWEYDLDLKPLGGFPVTFGFLSAVRRGHATLHRGIDVGVPSLVLRSDRSVLGGPYRAEIDSADAVLDVAQIARWSGCLGNRVTVVPVPGARHDVFLSRSPARDIAYAELTDWLARATPTLSSRRSVHAPSTGSAPSSGASS
ncbi:alpha/beta hydrolase [Williamsia deligens]